MAKTKRKPAPPEMEAIPYTNIVDVPVLDDTARAELMASLREAEEDIRAGRSTRLGPGALEEWLSARAARVRDKKA